MSLYPPSLSPLLSLLKKFPGVGTKTAERFAFTLLEWEPKDLEQLSLLLTSLPRLLPPCPECGCITDKGECLFCHNPKRDPSKLCIVGSAKDVFALESTHSFQGLYHVVEHLLSPLDGRHADQIRLERIEKKIATHQIQEIILGFDATLEGDTTALYLQNHLSSFPLVLSRMAFGIPVGSSLDYIDGGTLTRALQGRRSLT